MQKFGMLFQGAALFDSLPVWENVAFRLLQIERLGRGEARAKAIETLGMVGLGAPSPTCRRPSFRAACKSGSGLPARLPRSPRSCSSTSRPRASTRSWRT